MSRPRMSVEAMSESTRNKYSFADLRERESQEEYVKEKMNSSYIEENVIENIDDKKKLLYESYKKILTGIGAFTSSDAITLEILVDSITNLRLIKRLREVALRKADFDLLNKLDKNYTIWSKEINNCYKMLHIDTANRNRLSQLTADDTFVEDSFDLEELLKIANNR